MASAPLSLRREPLICRAVSLSAATAQPPFTVTRQVGFLPPSLFRAPCAHSLSLLTCHGVCLQPSCF